MVATQSKKIEELELKLAIQADKIKGQISQKKDRCSNELDFLQKLGWALESYNETPEQQALRIEAQNKEIDKLVAEEKERLR